MRIQQSCIETSSRLVRGELLFYCYRSFTPYSSQCIWWCLHRVSSRHKSICGHQTDGPRETAKEGPDHQRNPRHALLATSQYRQLHRLILAQERSLGCYGIHGRRLPHGRRHSQSDDRRSDRCGIEGDLSRSAALAQTRCHPS